MVEELFEFFHRGFLLTLLYFFCNLSCRVVFVDFVMISAYCAKKGFIEMASSDLSE